MLPPIFEKHKISLNRTKLLLIVNLSNIISKSTEDFAMEQCFFYLTSPFFLQCYKSQQDFFKIV